MATKDVRGQVWHADELSLSLFFFLNQMGVLFSYGALLYLDTRLELGLPGPRMLQTNRTQADKKQKCSLASYVLAEDRRARRLQNRQGCSMRR